MSPASTPVLSAARARPNASSYASRMVRSGTAMSLPNSMTSGAISIASAREPSFFL